MSQLIIGAAISIVSIILGFVLNAIYENHRDSKKIRNESLKNHFKQLEESAIKPMTGIVGGIANSGGILSIKGASYRSPSYADSIRGFKQGGFDIFKLHFLDQAENIAKLLYEVDKHNRLFESFTNKLKKIVEEKTGLPVREGKGRPFIYTSVPIYLQRTLCQLIEGQLLTHDFRQAKIEKKNDFWEVCTVGTIYAEITTEEEGNSCKASLITLMESSALLEEMSQILENAKRLENDSKSIANLLDFTCWQYRESQQLLNEEKDCPYCQVIFHRKKRSENETI